MGGKKEYIIKKALNNNVILAFDKRKGKEVVLVGKGIGFGKKEGQIVELEEKQIEKSFLAFEGDIRKEYYQLISEIDIRIIGVSEEIIAMAESEFGPLNNHIHIALTDHISFALDRIETGLEIHNPFIYEIKALYPKEFEMGERAAQKIKAQLGIDISESEMGFIALHIHSAKQSKKVGQTIKDTTFLMELVNIVEEELLIDIDNSGLIYSRLINHLRTSIVRMEEERHIKNPLLNVIKEQFSESYEIAIKIGDHIKKVKGLHVSEDELGYLALHIERIKETEKCVTE